MEYIFASSVFDLSQYEKIRSKSKLPLGLADHNLNANIILGIEENLGHPIKLVNNVQIPNYPNYPKFFFRRQKWSHVEGADDINCGFINLPVIKHFSRSRTTYCELKKLLKNADRSNTCLITYDLHYGISRAIAKIIRKYPELKTCIVMPDVPSAVVAASSEGRMGRKDKAMAKMKSRFISMYKSYVFITKQMGTVIDMTNKKSVVVEGIYNDHSPELDPRTTDKTVILYTGQLNPIYGLDNLVDAFLMIAPEHKDYELWFCGGGVMVERLSKLQKECPQIKYLGYCNAEEIRKYQSEASVMINPRQNTGEYTKFSFPSKTMEYIASGRPMIGYKLDGIPAEYDPFIFYVKDNSVEALKDTILEVCAMSGAERDAFGKKAREFILANKNPKMQCQRIVQMIEELK